MGSDERDLTPECVDFQAGELQVRLDVTVPGDFRAISPVVERVLALTDEMECAKGKEFEIETALREALSNAIRHGCANDGTKSVEVCVACEDSTGML